MFTIFKSLTFWESEAKKFLRIANDMINLSISMFNVSINLTYPVSKINVFMGEPRLTRDIPREFDF